MVQDCESTVDGEVPKYHAWWVAPGQWLMCWGTVIQEHPDFGHPHFRRLQVKCLLWTGRHLPHCIFPCWP